MLISFDDGEDENRAEAHEGRAGAPGRSSNWLFATLLALSLAVAWGVRAEGLADWLADPGTHFAQGVPGSSSDSYYWFRLAREIRGPGVEPGQIDRLRAWPEGLERGPTPAFPWLIATTARLFASDVYRTALVLNIVLSSLFILPLAFYGRRVGYPLAGLLAGHFGALADAYVQRSSVHRVDTDGGTLFLLCLLALGIASLRTAASPRRNTVTAVATGLCLAIFCRWYGQPGFWLVYAATMGLQLLAQGFPTREMVRLGGLFVIFANPLHAAPGIAGLAHFARYYVVPSPDALPSPLDYANITRDISELQPLPLVESLARVVDVPALTALGLVGFIAFALLRWRSAIALLPIAMLGLYSLVGPQRFGMYLAPLVGLGWGFLLQGTAAWAADRWASTRRLAEPVAYLVTVLAALLLLGHTGFAIVPKPTIGVPTITSLQALAAKLPPKAAVLASWGSGYLVADVTGAATFNDGEAPDPLVHYLFARAVSSADPSELSKIVAVLSTFGRSELHAAIDGAPDPRAAIDALLRRDARTDGNVVLLLSERDLRPFPTFFRTGRFDFELGDGPEDAYYSFSCKRLRARRLRCTNGRQEAFGVDLERGQLGADGWLRRVVEIRAEGGIQVSEHAPGAALTLQLVPRDEPGTYAAHLLSEAVYQSNFNQLFFLGRYDPTQIEEIHRDLPVIRAFRIRAAQHTNLLDGVGAIRMMEESGG